MANKPVMMFVGTNIPTFSSPEKADRFIDWYKKVHIPLTLKAPGMRRATLYRSTEPKMGCPEFMAVYEMESKEAVEKTMQSPEMLKAIEDGHQNGPLHGMDVCFHVFYEPV